MGNERSVPSRSVARSVIFITIRGCKAPKGQRAVFLQRTRGVTPQPGKAQALKDEITQRLLPVCGDWPDQLFQQLVNSITEITLKYDDRSERIVYDTTRSVRLIADMRNLAEKSADMRSRTPTSADVQRPSDQAEA